ncbi:MAG: Uma2 family endonuclease, partial [Polyangiaceae bacterium]|nr:Uma2 family endonuclease [Polyangiaceae bacterium]
MAVAEQRTMSLGEYRDLERESADKHEYAEGEIFAMAGASAAHNRVSANVVTELSVALRERPCTVYPSD